MDVNRAHDNGGGLVRSIGALISHPLSKENCKNEYFFISVDTVK